MKIFYMDLDNTIIYSYKHDIGESKTAVETYQGREISFVSDITYKLLEEVREKILIIPTTTRTQEQYERINLGKFSYAMVCNGGVLLIDGKRDENWHKTSLELIKPSKEALERSIKFLEEDRRRCFEVRFIEELFVFTKCSDIEVIVNELRDYLDMSLVQVFHIGTKLYVIPNALGKGKALERFKDYVDANYIISAGDSEFDVSMFKYSDLAFAPESLAKVKKLPPNTVIIPQQKLFSEGLLNYLLTTELQCQSKSSNRIR